MSIEIEKVEDIYPLSPMQEGFFFNALYNSEYDPYLGQTIYDIQGIVDRDIMLASWHKLCSIHSILRTCFIFENKKRPLQFVFKNISVPFKYLELTGQCNQLFEVKKLLEEDMDTGIDLSKAPVFRLTLIKLNESKYKLVWTHHHIITDGWSSAIIIRDLIKIYHGYRVGVNFTRPNYRNYIAWLIKRDKNNARVFWNNYLSSIESGGLIKYSDTLTKNDYSSYLINISETEVDNLKEFAARSGVTLNTIFQGVLCIVLNSWFRKKDILVGVTVSGRDIDLVLAQEMSGVFINTLPMKIEIDTQKGIRDYLIDLQNQTQIIIEYSYISLFEIQSISKVKGRLFDVIYVFENYHTEDYQDSSNLEFEIEKISAVERNEYPLSVVVVPGKKFIINFSFINKIFSEESIKKFSEDIRLTLSGICRKFSLEDIDLSGRFESFFGIEQDYDIDKDEVRKKYVAPSTKIEKEICKIWEEVLGTKRIGITDSFFKLGGHSLHAIRLISKIREKFCIEVSLKAFFRNPTIVKLEEIVEELLTKTIDSNIIPFTYLHKNEAVPLSSSQKRLWFIHQLLKNKSLYNVCFSLEFEGELNKPVLEKAINKIIQGHKILRTKFLGEGQDIHQVVIDNFEINLASDVEDLTRVDENYKLAVLEKIATKGMNHEFQLDKHPAIKFKLAILSKNENVLFITLHHIIFDGWSFDILLYELGEFYNSILYGTKNNLQQISYQYADYALWQKKWIDSVQFKEQLEYWKRELEDILKYIDLPTSNQRPLELSYKGSCYVFSVSSVIKDKIHDISVRYSISTFTILLSLYQILLHKYSGQNSFLVGSPVANRNHREIENLIGCFINILPLKAEFKHNDSFESFLSRVNETVLNAHENQDIPFEKLIDNLEFEREVNKNPMFQVLFTYEKHEIDTKKFFFKNLKVEEKAYVKDDRAKFDLSMHVSLYSEHLEVTINYAEDLFDVHMIKRMAENFKKLVAAAVSEPTIKISEIDILSDGEKGLLEEDYSKGDVGVYKKTISISQLFDYQTEKCPDKIVVISKGVHLTYSALKILSDRVSYRLQDACVPKGSIVALAFYNSSKIVAAIIGVIKSSCAYVPIDLSLPERRIKHILSDTGATAVIIEGVVNKSLKDYGGAIINLDDEVRTDEKKVRALNTNRSEDMDLLYVIYTSGSTGEPKGVMVSQKSLLNILNAMKSKLIFDSSSRWLSFTTISFDIAMLEIFFPLLNGFCLILENSRKMTDPRFFASVLGMHNPTIIQSTPVMWKLVLEHIPEILDQHKDTQILCGGEAVTTSTAIKIFKRTNNFLNLYGPTETTVWSTALKFQDNQYTHCQNKNMLPIGRPLKNTNVYILDKSLNMIPISVVGEIYISGEGVAIGYWNRPDLTAQSFIANPYRSTKDTILERNDRLYKTGDLARWLPNGDIEYVGRDDCQVKIRGHRIELGEVEDAIAKYIGVLGCVVIFHEDSSDVNKLAQNYLVGYYVSDNEIDQEDLFYHLNQTLPKYMIPIILIKIDRLPITISGKIDRKSLPKPKFESSTNFEYPKNQLEKETLKIWSEILSVATSEISVTNNFFRLGGDSILAIKLLLKLNDRFHKDISVADIFNNSSIRELARFLKNKKHDPDFKSVRKYKFTNPEHQLLSFAQERLWFIEKYENGTSAYNIPIVYRINSSVDVKLLKSSINKIIKRHKILRTLIKEDSSGRGYQFVLDAEQAKFEISSVHIGSRRELNEYFKRDAAYIFDLAQECPIKAKIYKLNKQHYLSIVVHHIAFDGWSVGIFLKELFKIYEYYIDLKNGKDRKLSIEAIDIHYKDFAIWQREYLSVKKLSAQLDYWKRRLKNYENLNIITDYPRPQNIDYRGKRKRFELDENLSSRLKQIAKRQNVSLFSLMFAAYSLMLRSYSNQNDIIVGTSAANRHYGNVHNLIGFFVNSIVLRIKIDPEKSISDFIKYVSGVIKKAQEYQDLPFEKLVGEIVTEKDKSRHPIFQVMFGIDTFEQQEEYKNGPSIFKDYDVGADLCYTSKFDISTLISEKKGKLTCIFEYSTALFKDFTIDNFIKSYEEILKQICYSDLKLRTEEFSSLTSEQYSTIIEGWNKTQAKYPKNKTINQVFEESVENYPDKIALTFFNKQLTYKKLNENSNKLAQHLVSLGLKKEATVAICLDRSIELITSILAVLKAGCAYVPLDTSYPDEVLKHILNDSKVSVLITQKNILQKFSEFIGKVLLVDDNEHKWQNCPNENLRSKLDPSNLAYVIYTSGSTGKPKGVMIEHKGVVFSIYARLIHYRSLAKNCLLIPSIAFDSSVAAIFWPLLNGSTLTLPQQDEFRDAYEVAKLIHKHKITHIQSIPIFHSALLEHSKYMHSLQLVVVAGEPCFKELVELHSTNLSSTILANEYGPTEVSVWNASSLVYNPKTGNIPDLITIGKSAPNARNYILDMNLNPVPVGVIGELYVGGDGVGRGYWGKADLTSEKFIANPFITGNTNKTERLYKTGDLARWLPNGEIEYIGRNDSQVKIRGFRVELGHIETVLSSYKKIKKVAVVAKQRKRKGENYLACYYESEEPLYDNQILEYLAVKLPEYMIPKIFMRLDTIPLTSNGKIDRKALPSPSLTMRQASDGYVSPATEIEQKLAYIWGEVLKIEPIGIHDNFFRVGGDSIIVIQLVAKARNAGINFAVKDIFNYPTISALASIISSEESSEKTTIKPQQNEVTGEIHLTPIQQWFFKKDYHNKNHYNQSFMLNLNKLSINFLLIKKSIKLLLAYHDVLRCRYKKPDNELSSWKQFNLEVIKEDINSIWVNIDLSNTPDPELAKSIKIHSNSIQQDLNIEHGPLIKAALFNCGHSRPAKLLIVIHHLIVDGVSWRVLLEDLENIYKALEKHEDTPCLIKTHSYQQWSNALINYTKSSELIKEVDYWKEIEEATARTKLVKDFDKEGEYDYRLVSLSLTEKETINLLKRVPKAYRTKINDILLAALTLAIGDWTKNYEVIISLEGHGREDIGYGMDTSRTVGWFTSIFPVCLKTDNPKDLGYTIKVIKEELRKIPNNGIGYGVLAFLTNHLPKTKINPNLNQPDISFNYLGQWDNTLSREGIFSFAEEESKDCIAKENKDPYLLNINSEVRNGVFSIHFGYNSNNYKANTIEKLAKIFIDRLKQIINHCTTDGVFGYTPSDFKLVNLDENKIAERIRMIEES